VQKKWLREKIYNTPPHSKPRWEHFGTIKEEPSTDMTFTIRHIRVVFVVPDELFYQIDSAKSAEAHEYFLPLTRFQNRLIWTKSFKNFALHLTPQANFFGR
jgi:hypothetical protein